MKILIAILVIAAVVVAACAMLGGGNLPPIEKIQTIRALPNRTNFLHRWDAFKPTLGNAALLGFMAGCAFVSIVFSLCIYFSK